METGSVTPTASLSKHPTQDLYIYSTSQKFGHTFSLDLMGKFGQMFVYDAESVQSFPYKELKGISSNGSDCNLAFICIIYLINEQSVFCLTLILPQIFT